jgi:hypothetical protein
VQPESNPTPENTTSNTNAVASIKQWDPPLGQHVQGCAASAEGYSITCMNNAKIAGGTTSASMMESTTSQSTGATGLQQDDQAPHEEIGKLLHKNTFLLLAPFNWVSIKLNTINPTLAKQREGHISTTGSELIIDF